MGVVGGVWFRRSLVSRNKKGIAMKKRKSGRDGVAAYEDASTQIGVHTRRGLESRRPLARIRHGNDSSTRRIVSPLVVSRSRHIEEYNTRRIVARRVPWTFANRLENLGTPSCQSRPNRKIQPSHASAIIGANGRFAARQRSACS